MPTERDRERNEQHENELKKSEGEESDPHGASTFIKKPPYFVCGLALAIIIFYIVALCFAFAAYKEFKGIAEEAAGG